MVYAKYGNLGNLFCRSRALLENWEIVFLRTPPGHKRWCLDRKGGSKLIAKRKSPINSLGDKQILLNSPAHHAWQSWKKWDLAPHFEPFISTYKRTLMFQKFEPDIEDFGKILFWQVTQNYDLTNLDTHKIFQWYSEMDSRKNFFPRSKVTFSNCDARVLLLPRCTNFPYLVSDEPLLLNVTAQIANNNDVDICDCTVGLQTFMMKFISSDEGS